MAQSPHSMSQMENDGTPGDRIVVFKYVNNTSINIRGAGAYQSEVRIYGIKA